MLCMTGFAHAEPSQNWKCGFDLGAKEEISGKKPNILQKIYLLFFPEVKNGYEAGQETIRTLKIEDAKKAEEEKKNKKQTDRSAENSPKETINSYFDIN